MNPFALLLAPVAAALAVGGFAVRTVITMRRERDSAARHILGPDGIIVGAESFQLAGSAQHAVLLLHGFGDTPQTMRYIADFLHDRGWTVRAPLLPSHGRRLRELARGRAGAWISAARDELVDLRKSHETVSVVGLSMGAALAAVISAETAPPALVLLAPYLSMPRHIRIAAATSRIWGPLIPYVRGGGEESVHDERERARTLGPGYSTGRLLRELYKVVRRARRALPGLTCPTLMICSREDNRIPASDAARNFAMLTSPVRELVWRNGTGHVITVDFGRDEVFALASDWITRHAGAPEMPGNRAVSAATAQETRR